MSRSGPLANEWRLDATLGPTKAAVKARDVSDWVEKERLLLEACHPKQRQFVEDTGRRVAALVARGGGKTTGGRARLVRRMLSTPKAKCLYIATTRAQAEELLWYPLKELVEKLGIDAKFNETKLRCTFVRNGATLRLVGADDKREIEKLRGQPFHEVGIDEAASFPTALLEALLRRILGPRMGDYNGTIWLIGTPSHVLSGPFYEATRPGSEVHRRWEDRDLPEFDGWLGWSLHSWALQDGAPFVPAMKRLWAEAQVEKKSNGWSDKNPIWRREYLGQWAADDTENIFKYRPHTEDGDPWNQWDPPRNAQGFAVLPDRGDWRYVYGFDLGHSDPTALEVFAWSPTDPTKTLYHVYEFVKKGMYPRTIAELLLGAGLDHNAPSGVLAGTGWPDGMVAGLESLGGGILDELRQVYGINIKAAEKKNKHDAIEMANGDLIDGRIKVLKGSELEIQMIHNQWAVNDYGKLVENKSQRNDATDAFVYGRREAYHLFSEEASVPQPVFPVRKDPIEEDPEEDRGEFANLLGSDSFDFWGD